MTMAEAELEGNQRAFRTDMEDDKVTPQRMTIRLAAEFEQRREDFVNKLEGALEAHGAVPHQDPGIITGKFEELNAVDAEFSQQDYSSRAKLEELHAKMPLHLELMRKGKRYWHKDGSRG